MNFTTKDEDNDTNDQGNCALKFKGAWWYIVARINPMVMESTGGDFEALVTH